MAGYEGSPDISAFLAQLQPIMQQLGPTEDEKRQARGTAALMAAAGLLGTRKGFEGQGIGQAIQGGLLGYNQDMRNISQQRASNIGAASSLLQMQKQLGMMEGFGNIFNDGPAPAQVSNGVAPTAGVSPRTASQFANPSDTAGFQAMPPAQPTVPQGTPPTGVNGFSPPDWRQTMPSAVKASIRASMDPKVAAEYLTKWSETKMGPDGTVTDMGGRPLYRATPQGVLYFDPGGSTRFVAYDQASNKAAAEQAGAVKGAETAAQEAAQFPYRTGQATGPRGEPIYGFQSQLYGQPGGQAGQPTGDPNKRVTLNLNNTPIGEAYAALKDAQGGGGMPAVGQSPGTIRGASPVDIRAAEEGILTGEQQKREGWKTMLENSKAQYDDITKRFTAAKAMANHADNMAKADKGELFSGPGGAIAAAGANWFNSLIPGANVEGSRLADTQYAASEVSKMQQALGKAFPGQQSNYELQTVTNALPTLMITPEGRQRIYAAIKQASAMETANYRSASQHYKANNGNLVGWEPVDMPPIEQFKSGPSNQAPVNKRWVFDGKKMVPQ
jgi:hypothetical protein